MVFDGLRVIFGGWEWILVVLGGFAVIFGGLRVIFGGLRWYLGVCE